MAKGKNQETLNNVCFIVIWKLGLIMTNIDLITIIASNLVFTLTLFLWNRSESRNDRKDANARAHEYRQSMRELAVDFKDEVQQEIRDFHGRLCTIEERKRK
jgi:hypothetical protein